MPPAPPVTARERVLEVPGCSLRVWEGGDGARLVVLTDCGDPLELWTPAFVALARRWSVTMIEQPGFGYSDASPDFDYRWAAHFDALRRAFDRLDVQDARAVGHCVGGTQLLALDADAPGRIRATVLAETFPAARYRDLGTGMLLHRLARLPGIGELASRASSAGVRRGARYLLGALSERADWPTDAELTAYVAPVVEGHNTRGGVLHVRHWDGEVAEPVERASQVPATYLFGAGGRFARHLEERSRYARECGRDVAVLDGTGHFLFAERPDAFVDRVDQILGLLAP